MQLSERLLFGRTGSKSRFRLTIPGLTARTEPPQETSPSTSVRPSTAVTSAKGRANPATPDPSASPPVSAWTLLERCARLTRDPEGNLRTDGQTIFVVVPYDECIPRPTDLPSVAVQGNLYVLVPAIVELTERWRPNLSPNLPGASASDGAVFMPDEFRWPVGDDIATAIAEYETLASHARTLREARDLLARERKSAAGLYASVDRAADAPSMLVDGLIPERGVSVVYGGFDEFKTTLVLDLLAHVAMGVPWQGRAVSQRPVVWYALDGADDIALRLRVFEDALRCKGAAWGQDRAPFSLRRHIPEGNLAWRTELCRLAERWESVSSARRTIGELSLEGTTPHRIERPPVVVVDTLSMALGDAFEQVARAVRFGQECLDLVRERGDHPPSPNPNDRAALPAAIDHPVASHVILIHSQTTADTQFDGPGVIRANTQGLYRVHRFGNCDDAARPMEGQLTPIRVKGMVRPAPVRFSVKAVPLDGTTQTAAVLEDMNQKVEAKAEVEVKAVSITPKGADAVIDALRDRGADYELTPAELEDYLDMALDCANGKSAAQRKARQRLITALRKMGAIEPADMEDDKILSWRFHSQ